MEFCFQLHLPGQIEIGREVGGAALGVALNGH